MSLRSNLYWIDRAFKGDRRPLYFLAGWLIVVALLLACYALTQ